MQDAVTLGVALVVLFVAGHALNAAGQSIYWWWQDRKGDEDV
jgi:hypothetical protein